MERKNKKIEEIQQRYHY